MVSLCLGDVSFYVGFEHSKLIRSVTIEFDRKSCPLVKSKHRPRCMIHIKTMCLLSKWLAFFGVPANKLAAKRIGCIHRECCDDMSAVFWFHKFAVAVSLNKRAVMIFVHVLLARSS